jgi:hypothetical protein
MILTGYCIPADASSASANAIDPPVGVVFEPFALVKDVLIGKLGIDGMCVVHDGNCSVVRASVWKDVERPENGSDQDGVSDAANSDDEPEHEEISLRDYQLAMLIRANAEFEGKLKEVVSTSTYYQFGDSKTTWRSVDASGKFRAASDTVDSIFPAKAIQDRQGRLLVTCTVYPLYVHVTFNDSLTADMLNLVTSTNKLMGAMNL